MSWPSFWLKWKKKMHHAWVVQAFTSCCCWWVLPVLVDLQKFCYQHKVGRPSSALGGNKGSQESFINCSGPHKSRTSYVVFRKFEKLYIKTTFWLLVVQYARSCYFFSFYLRLIVKLRLTGCLLLKRSCLEFDLTVNHFCCGVGVVTWEFWVSLQYLYVLDAGLFVLFWGFGVSIQSFFVYPTREAVFLRLCLLFQCKQFCRRCLQLCYAVSVGAIRLAGKGVMFHDDLQLWNNMLCLLLKNWHQTLWKGLFWTFNRDAYTDTTKCLCFPLQTKCHFCGVRLNRAIVLPNRTKCD